MSGSGQPERPERPGQAAQPEEHEQPEEQEQPEEHEQPAPPDPSAQPGGWLQSAGLELQGELVTARLFGEAAPKIDRFEVERLLGAGASAEVYAARDPVLDRRVAIKLLARPAGGGGDAVEHAVRLLPEARALARLSHRNVVAIYDVGSWRGRPFIAMELIDGQTLAVWLQGAPRRVREILAVFREAGLGLAEAHRHGHVHRDFKPANVLVASDGRVVVTDFGLVGRVRVSEQGGDGGAAGTSPVGTPAYVAPEQREGAPAHPSADVYSFALALTEAVLGQHPQPETDARWQPALRRRVSPPVYRELARALEPVVERRTSSLGPLLAALLAELPTALQARPARHRARWLAALALAALAAQTALPHRGPWLVVHPGGGGERAAWVAAIGGGVAERVAEGGAERGAAGATEGVADEATERLAADAVERPGTSARSLVAEVSALLATPPAKRALRWQARARQVLMAPVPVEVPCRWPAGAQAYAVTGRHALALDGRQTLWACDLHTAAVAMVAQEVLCLQRPEGNLVGVTRVDGTTDVLQDEPTGWRLLAQQPPSSPPEPGRAPFRCESGRRVTSLVDPPLLARPARGRVSARLGVAALWLDAAGRLSYHPGGGAPRVVARRVSRAVADASLRRVLVVDDRFRILDLATGHQLAELVEPPARIGLLVLSPDGSTALVRNGMGRLWWWQEGASWRRSVATPVLSPALSPDRRSVVGIGAGPEGGVEVQSLWTGRRYPLASGAMRAVAFMDADRVAAVGEQGEVFRWSLSQQRMQVLADHEIAGGSAWGLAVSAQEDLVATSTSSRRDQVVRISSLVGGPQQSWPLPQGQIHALSFAGSSVVAGTTWGRLQVKDLATGRSTSTALGTYRWLWTAAPLPGGGYLVGTGHSLGADQRRGNARLLHVQGDEVHEIFAARPGGNTGISDIQLTPDGRRAVAASSAGDLVLFDLPHGKATVLDHVAGATAGDPVFALVEGGEAVVTGGGDSTLRVWDATTGELRSELRLGAGRIYDLAVQGETARVLVATSDGHLGLWNLATGRQERSYRGHTTAILRARFDREHRLVVSSDLSGRVCVRSVDSEGCSTWLEGHRPGESIFRVQFLRDRRLLTFSNDGAARLWRPLVTSDAAELARELEQRVFSPVPASTALERPVSEVNPRGGLQHAVSAELPGQRAAL